MLKIPKHSGALWLAMAGLCAGLLLAACGGCGGCRSGPDPYAPWGGMSKEEWLKQREERLRKEREEEARLKAADEEAKRKARQQAEARRKAAQAKAGDTARQPTQGEAHGPRVPQDVATWTDEQCILARDAQDPRLVQAIAWRGRTKRGDPNEAKFLLALLERPRNAADAAQGRFGGGMRNDRRALLGAVVEALVANGTAEAQAGLEALLAGQGVVAEEAGQACQAVVQALVGDLTAQNRTLLARVLVEPQRYCPPTRRELAPDQLQQTALSVVRRLDDRALRTLVAEELLRPQVSLASRRVVGAWLLAPEPANAEAQAILYAADYVPPELASRIERQLAAAGTWAVWRLLGVEHVGQAEAPSVAGQPVSPVDPEVLRTLAGHLWSRPWARVLAVRLGSANSLAEGADLVALASTVPRQETREVLQRTLRRFWSEGPEALRKAGLGTAVVPEIGFLAVLDRAGAALRDTRQARGVVPVRGLREAQAGKGAPGRAAPQVEDQWRTMQLEVMRRCVAQLREAARVAALRTADNASREAAAVQSPPFPGAMPILSLEHRLIVPRPKRASPVRADVPEPSWPEPEEIAYARFQARGSLERVVSHYRRYMGAKAEVWAAGGDVVLSRFAGGEEPSDWQWEGVLVSTAAEGQLRPDRLQEITIETVSLRHHGPQPPPDEEKNP